MRILTYSGVTHGVHLSAQNKGPPNNWAPRRAPPKFCENFIFGYKRFLIIVMLMFVNVVLRLLVKTLCS